MKTILIVEDERMNRDLLVAILEANGCATVTAEDGENGVQAARDHRPSLILMDIQMPRMDGVEAMRLLRADDATRDIPVVAVTAFALEEDQQRFRQAGFDAVLVKPLGIDTLFEVVHKHARP